MWLMTSLSSPNYSQSETRNLKLRSRFSFLDFFDERRHNLEQISHHCVVSDLEDRCLAVLIHRDDGARALHPNDVLDGSRDPQRQIKFWRHRLSGGTDLAVHRKPAGIADGA